MRRLTGTVAILATVGASMTLGRAQNSLAFGLQTVPVTTSAPGVQPLKQAAPTKTPTRTPTPISSPTTVATAGATAAIGVTVTPTASGAIPVAAGTIVAQDLFAGRTVSSGWGVASGGSPWTLQSGSASLLSVSSNEGRINGSGSSPENFLTLGSTTLLDTEVVARYSTGNFADDNGRIVLRWNNASNFYAAGIASPSGTELDVYRWSGGVKTRLCGVAFSAINSAAYWERVRIANSGGTATITVKAWASGASEPASPQLTCTDTSPLGSGLVGVDGWDGGVGWAMDSLSAGNLDGVGTPTPTVTATASPMPTATASPAPTATVAPSATPTSGPTATPTATPTVRPTASPDPTAVPTPTVTPSPLPSATTTATATSTPSPSPTWTNTPTLTPTPTTANPVAAGTPIAGDTFTGRTTSAGWGTASDGSAWTLQSGSASLLSVAGGEGIITGTGSSPTENLTIGTAVASDVEVVGRYSTGAFADDNGRFLLRYSDASDYYAAGFASPSGAELDVYRWSGGVKTRLCGVAFSAIGGTKYWQRVRIQTSGSTATISVKAWPDGTVEPSSPQLSCTDTAPLPAGLVGVNAWDGGVTWTLDHFSAGNLGVSGTPTPTPSPVPTPTGTPAPVTAMVAAAGDISCAPGESPTATSCQQGATASLLAQGGYNAVLALGDDQYDSGALAEFEGSYDPTWGALKSVTHPVPGNHEYNTSGASGYYSYFGAQAGNASQGYYSFDVGGWHMIALNSNCASIGGCQAGSAEEQWLRSDLAAHPATCTLAYYHYPRWSSGEEGDKLEMSDIWTDLANAHVAIVLNGHDHDYERFAPQDANGNASATGTREFVVGTGGENHAFFYQVQPNSQVRDDQTFGILQLTLHPASYDWQFLPIAGQTFTDSGSGSCP